MTLTKLALAALLSLARPPAVDPVAERPRLEALAEAIAEAVDETDALPFGGTRAREGAALALVAIAAHESGLRADVSDCRRMGDDGRSITAFQLQSRWAWGPYSRDELCASPRLAARRALAVLATHGRCRSPAAWFRGYSAGDCSKPSAAARRQCTIWERLARRAGLDARCDRREVFDAAAGRGSR